LSPSDFSNKKLSYRRETARQLRMSKRITSVMLESWNAQHDAAAAVYKI